MITPTPHQEEIITSIVNTIKNNQFSHNVEDLQYLLEGEAGTGKTSVMELIIDRIKDRIPLHKILIVAPTHRALVILKQKILIAVDFMTTASLIGLRPDTDVLDFNPDDSKFEIKGESRMEDYRLILHDECSMINEALFDKITSIQKTTKCQILFSGDRIQLPPIKENISKSFNIKNKFVLSELIRQSETNPLVELLKILRTDILHEINSKEFSNKWVNFIKANPSKEIDNEGYSTIKQNEALSLLSENFKKEFPHNHQSIKFITYTNKSVRNVNDNIKPVLTGQEFVSRNELLTAYSAANGIHNSEDYRVTHVSEQKVRFSPISGNIGFCSKSSFDTTYSFCFNVIRLALVSILTDEELTAYILKPENYSFFTEQHFKIFNYNSRGFVSAKAKKLYPNYLEFTNEFLLLDDLYYNRQLDRTEVSESTNNFKFKSKTFDRGYAITTHKSQGSTFNTVYVNVREMVDFQNLNMNRIQNNFKLKGTQKQDTLINNSVEFKKLIYVALSRASRFAYLIL